VAERPLRIGAVPILDGSGGGIYQYSQTLLDGLLGVEPRPELILLVERGQRAQAEIWRSRGYRVEPLWPTGFGWKLHLVGERLARRTGRGPEAGGGVRALPELGKWLRGLGVDLLVLPAPSLLGMQAGLPYVMAVHDLAHRLHPEFPEVGAGPEWDARERLFGNGIRHAHTVLVDSEVGRDDVLDCYGGLIAPDRIGILPFLPAAYLAQGDRPDGAALRSEMDVPERYLFFPAQFWPHKNHLRVVQAVAKIRAERGVDVPVVMCGSASDPLRSGIRDRVRQTAEESGVGDLVKVMGYVEDKWMAPLYAGSRGVLLPTFFGPTNIPVLEAWAFGVPALTSDLRGIREQCGDAAVLVDPGSVASVAEGMYRIWSDEPLRARVVEAGNRRLAAYGRPEFVARLSAIVADAGRRLGADSGSAAPGPTAPRPAPPPASSAVATPAGATPAGATPASGSGAHIPAVSVVVPAYNRSRTIGAAIESIRAQTFGDFEIVFVDDGSGDETVEIARAIAASEPRLRIHVHSLNCGAQSARNTGIKAARADWIAFLDADDTFYPTSLEARLEEARKGGFDVVHSGCDAIDSEGTVKLFPVPPFKGNVYRDVLLAPGPMFQGLLVKRQALLGIGLLRESVPAYQEWDTSIRLAARHEFGFVEKPTFLYDLRTQGAISRDGRRGADGYEHVVTAHWREVARVAGLRALADHYRIAARLRSRIGDRRGAVRCVAISAFVWPFSPRVTLRAFRRALGRSGKPI
jgi:glycosyltransferase involved in cell wall biosynthesis